MNFYKALLMIFRHLFENLGQLDGNKQLIEAAIMGGKKIKQKESKNLRRDLEAKTKDLTKSTGDLAEFQYRLAFRGKVSL
jgi:hypothetical protein